MASILESRIYQYVYVYDSLCWIVEQGDVSRFSPQLRVRRRYGWRRTIPALATATGLTLNGSPASACCTVPGSNAIIALRCSKLSGRLQDFWERRSERRAA